MAHPDVLLPRNEKAVPPQQVVHRRNGSGGAVLDGDHRPVRRPVPELVAGILEGTGGDQLRFLPEIEKGRFLGIGPGDPAVNRSQHFRPSCHSSAVRE